MDDRNGAHHKWLAWEHARLAPVLVRFARYGVPAFAGTTVAREGAFRAEEGATLTTVAREGAFRATGRLICDRSRAGGRR